MAFIKPNVRRSFVLCALVFLAGCSAKPPECGAPQTLATIQNLTVTNARSALPNVVGADALQDDPTKIQESYFAAVKTTLSEIVSDGYNADARKNSCRAKLTLSMPSGQVVSREVEYATQVTQDKSGDFVVAVQDYEPFIQALAGDFNQFFQAKRYGGEWQGTYACAGIDGQTTGPQGPFSMNAAISVDAQGEVTLERTTHGGGSEKLTGTMGRELKLSGGGQNTPDDMWRTFFKGQVQGLKVTAQGQIVTPEGRLLRQCTLDMTRAGGAAT